MRSAPEFIQPGSGVRVFFYHVWKNLSLYDELPRQALAPSRRINSGAERILTGSEMRF